MPVDFPDVLRSTRADGRLVGAEAVYDPNNLFHNFLFITEQPSVLNGNTIEVAISGLGSDDLPIARILYFLTPLSIPRARDDLSLRVNGRTILELHDIAGGTLCKDQVTPNIIYGVFRGTSYRMLAPIGERPQDYNIRCAVSADTTLTEAEVSSGTFTTLTSNIVLTPTAPEWPDNENRYMYFGVPDNTGDIIQILSGGIDTIAGYTKISGTVNDAFGNAYKWWQSTGELTYEFYRGIPIEIVQQ